MSRTERALPTVAALMQRFEAACTFKQAVDLPRIEAAMQAWARRVTKVPVSVVFLADAEGVREKAWAARAARAARDAWAARAARDAWAARDARDARAAWDARDARAAWDARDAWAAWDARDARAARDAWEISYVAIIALGAAERDDRETFEKWAPLLDALEAGAFCFWITDKDEIAVGVLPSALHLDAQRRLHCETGPAFSWLKDIHEHYWHGVRVDPYIVLEPDKITVELIEAEKNAEVRRVMIERYGDDRYVLDSGMKPVASDPVFGDLYVREFESGRPIAKICVTNRTAEPDGHFRKYWLDINPKHYDGDAGRIPQAAVASTWRTTPGGKDLFFKDWRHYRPVIET